MNKDYMPTTDADFDLWQLNYNSLIQINPSTYGLDASYAAALAPLSADFHTKLGIASNSATRTPVSIAEKDSSRAALKSFIRVGVGIVQHTPAVTVGAKEALQIPVHDTVPSPVPAPTTYPKIDAEPGGHLLTVIDITDSGAPDVRRRPENVAAMALFGKAVVAGQPPITDPEQLEFLGLVSRTRLQQAWAAEDANKTMYLAGTWVTRTGKRGPWGPISATGIAA